MAQASVNKERGRGRKRASLSLPMKAALGGSGLSGGLISCLHQLLTGACPDLTSGRHDGPPCLAFVIFQRTSKWALLGDVIGSLVESPLWKEKALWRGRKERHCSLSPSLSPSLSFSLSLSAPNPFPSTDSMPLYPPGTMHPPGRVPKSP